MGVHETQEASMSTGATGPALATPRAGGSSNHQGSTSPLVFRINIRKIDLIFRKMYNLSVLSCSALATISAGAAAAEILSCCSVHVPPFLQLEQRNGSCCC